MTDPFKLHPKHHRINLRKPLHFGTKKDLPVIYDDNIFYIFFHSPLGIEILGVIFSGITGIAIG
jgi:hypothetical protein